MMSTNFSPKKVEEELSKYSRKLAKIVKSSSAISLEVQNKYEVNSAQINKEKSCEPVSVSSKPGYVGMKQDGLKHGQGVLTLKSGEVLAGEWNEGKIWNGKGTFVRNGETYSGDWVEGLRHGQGVQKRKNGDVYEGGWSKGKKHGEGVLKYQDGTVYKGGFNYNAYKGLGLCRYADGGVYWGEWGEESKRSGLGVYKSKEGHTLSGQWQWDSLYTGEGTKTDEDGDCYTGGWIDFKKQGPFSITYVNGGAFNGVYFAGKVWEGQGTHKIQYYTGGIPEGADLFTGTWKEGKKHGHFEIKYALGDTFSGVFRDNKVHEGVGSIHHKGLVGNEWINVKSYKGIWKEGEYHCE